MPTVNDERTLIMAKAPPAPSSRRSRSRRQPLKALGCIMVHIACLLRCRSMAVRLAPIDSSDFTDVATSQASFCRLSILLARGYPAEERCKTSRVAPEQLFRVATVLASPARLRHLPHRDDP